jgi:hypothetical protein
MLDYCEGLSDVSLSKVAMSFVRIRRLEIEWCQVSQKCVEVIVENLKHLTVVNFGFCPAVCDREIFTLANNRTSSLQVLKLRNINHLSRILR